MNPLLFLERAGSVYSGTTDLGHVQGGQYVGYLFPMGPWYGLMHLIGMPTWVAQRLWLGMLLFAGAWGMIRLLDAMLGDKRGVAHAVAAILYAFNPYTVTFASRATVTLLATAILPWLMLAAVRGVRDPRGWRWPAVVGLLMAVSGGGVNVAVLAWLLLAPTALLVWEATMGGLGRAPARAFALRASVCGLAGSLWWAIPVFIQGGYGSDFLKFTEQPQTIWATTSMSESLRLLGYWPLYLGTGYGDVLPVMRAGQTYLFDPIVVVGSLLVPVVALSGLRTLRRRWSYAPFFGLLACASLVILFAGFPHGTAASRTFMAAYEHVPALRFMRTTYKAAPILALALAALGGATAAVLVNRVRASARPTAPAVLRGWPRLAGLARHATLPGIGLALLALTPLVWALPFFSGHAIDRRLGYDHVPAAWHAAISDAGAAAAENRRTMVLPGELFGDYTWGETWDSVAPGLTRRPVVVRQAVRYGDQRGAQLLEEVDDSVQQARLVPDQLPPLLQLMGIGEVVVPTDAFDSQSAGLDPVTVVRSLSRQPGFEFPLARYGPSNTFTPPVGRGGPRLRLPELRRYAVLGTPGIVHLDSRLNPTILDGGPGGVVDLAAHGGVVPGRALAYAADVPIAQLRAMVAAGARLVFTDSNQRRIVSSTTMRQDTGPTVTPDAPLPDAAARWDPFPRDGNLARTTAAYGGGLKSVTAPQPAGAPLYPAFRPFAALDGDSSTSWLPDPYLPPSQRWMKVTFAAPRPIGTISVTPKPIEGIARLWVAISVNGGAEREVLLKPEVNQVAINRSDVTSLRFRLSRATSVALFLGAGGLTEIDIPGVQPTEALRLPSLLALRSSGLDLSHNELSVVLRRTTADFPSRAGNDEGIPLARSELGAKDPETGIRRIITLPTTRHFSVSGWASVSPTASDAAIDGVAGLNQRWAMTSSSRFEGVPARRASSAFDRNPRTAWVGDVVPFVPIHFGEDQTALPLAAANELVNGLPGAITPPWHGGLNAPVPWLAIRGPKPALLRRLRLLPGPPEYATPAVVSIQTDAGTTRPLTVAPDGTVRLPAPVTTRGALIRILRVHPPHGQPGARLLRAVAISQVVSPFHPPAPRRSGLLGTPCGTLSVYGPFGRAQVAVTGTIGELDDGTPLQIVGCRSSAPITLPPGASTVTAPAGLVMRPDHLMLDSPAPVPLPAPRAPGIATVAGAPTATGIPQAADVAATGPAWLVLGEGYSPGWHASCRDATGHSYSLGAPLPLDGFGNGWPINRTCNRASFVFAPQRVATAGYLLSLAGLAIMFALAFVIPRRRRWVPIPLTARPVRLVANQVVRAGGFESLAIGLVSTVVIGFFFGIPIGPLAVPIAWRGTSPRRLLTIGAVLLATVPAAYLIRSAPNAGGYDFNYAFDNLLGHWFAVAGICSIAAGLVLDLYLALRSRASAPISPPAVPAPESARDERPSPAPVASL